MAEHKAKSADDEEAMLSKSAPTVEATASQPAEAMEEKDRTPLEETNDTTEAKTAKHTPEPPSESAETPLVLTDVQRKHLSESHPTAIRADSGLADDTQTKTTAGNPDRSAIEDKPPAPTLIIEKVDSEPRHGDDFGESSTIEQTDAHHLRAHDAEPDIVVVRSETRTPDIAEVAAEVADSAATLDREQPTPPISDEEAGRIGFRRMSTTPIPEVANTAAEVADIAAKLDGETGVGFIYLPSTSPDRC